ncbi:MAG: tetratricopeptide repeat protein [Candidatus Neomarinimicrobiota bacterium]
MKIINYILIFFCITNTLAQQNSSINASIKTAHFLEKRGDIDGALSIYKDILNKNPKHNISIQKIKLLYLNYERYNDGIDFLKARIKINPNNMKLYSELGEFYFLNNEKEKAQKIWSEGLTKFKNNRSYYRNMVSIYGKHSLNDNIEIILNKGKKRFGESFLSYESGVYFQSNRIYDKAMDHFIIYLIHEPKQIGIIERRILLMSDEEDAIQIIEDKLLKASEKNPRKILNVLSEYYFKQQNYEKAFKKKKDWSSLVKNNSDEWLKFANELRKESQFAHSIKSYNYILNKDPNLKIAGKALLGLAQTFENQIIPSNETYLIPFFFDNNMFFEDPFHINSTISNENLSLSIALYDSILVTMNKSPLLAEAFFKLGEIQYRILQDFDKAHILFNNAIKNNPNKKLKLQIVQRIADVLMAKGQSKDAENFLIKQLRMNPMPKMELKRILIHFLNNKPDSTLEMVNSTLFNLIPIDPLFNDLIELKNIITNYYSEKQIDQKAFNHFIKSENFLRQNKLGNSIEELQFIKNELTDSKIIPLVNLRLSLLYYRLKNYDSALSIALSLKNTDLADKGIILAGQIYEFKFSNIEKALDYYMKILDEYPKSIYSEPIRYHIREMQKIES